MFDQALSGIENRAKNKVEEKLAQSGKDAVDKLDLLEEMLATGPHPQTPPPTGQRTAGALRRTPGLHQGPGAKGRGHRGAARPLS
ncbi:MAG: hypothetical protein WCF33_17965, partial [Pseudonocardiaceae bacterium]